MHRDESHYVDSLRDDIWQNHSQIHIVDFDFYSVDVFNRCENGNDVLMAVPVWRNVQTDEQIETSLEASFFYTNLYLYIDMERTP